MIFLTFLTVLLPSLTMSASPSSDFLMPGAIVTPSSEPSPKCRLTRLEEDIQQLEKLESSKHYLPTIRQLKKKYPGEQFVRSGEGEGGKCLDEITLRAEMKRKKK